MQASDTNFLDYTRGIITFGDGKKGQITSKSTIEIDGTTPMCCK